MSLPKLIFREISTLAILAAKVDQFVLGSRNICDDSYGSESNIKAKITLSLAVLKCYVKKGLPFDSPRLSGLYTWIQSRVVKSSDILITPLRLAAAAIVNENSNSVKMEISNTLSLLEQYTEKATITKPILFMLSIESLSFFTINSSNNEIVANAVCRLPKILHSEAVKLSVISYAATLLLQYGDNIQKGEALKKWEEIAQGGKIKEDKCIVETSYIAINALKCIERLPVLRSTVDQAIEFLCSSCPNGIPKEQLIQYTPKELGNDIQAKKIYAAAVIVQVIVESLGRDERGCLEFAHASWQLEIKKGEDEKNKLIKRIHQYQIIILIIGSLFVITLFLLLTNLKILRSIFSFLGSAAGIIGLFWNFIKDYKRCV